MSITKHGRTNHFLKENCATSAAPNVQDVTTMTPQAAYDAGRNDAINEIMEKENKASKALIHIDPALMQDPHFETPFSKIGMAREGSCARFPRQT